MNEPIESVILCEGVHDRAFWRGLLMHRLSCRDARPELPTGGFGPARDPFDKPVVQGQFAFLTPSNAFVRVRPCSGDKGVMAELKKRLAERTTNALARLVVGLDVDASAADEAMLAARIATLREGVEKRVRQADAAAITNDEGDFVIDGGATIVSVMAWSAHDAHTEELPSKQTLERLVCAALRAAFPTRGEDVAAWLRSRRDAPAGSEGLVKEHAWSHMAGWFALSNCDDFYQAVWRDRAVAAQLEGRLRAAGAWRIAEAIAA